MTGEGGMLVTDNAYYAKKARLIRNHGEAIMDDEDSNKEIMNIVAVNYRLTELQAAIGTAQTSKLIISIHSEIRIIYILETVESLHCDFITPSKNTAS